MQNLLHGYILYAILCFLALKLIYLLFHIFQVQWRRRQHAASKFAVTAEISYRMWRPPDKSM